jgi:hypothetical protein
LFFCTPPTSKPNPNVFAIIDLYPVVCDLWRVCSFLRLFFLFAHLSHLLSTKHDGRRRIEEMLTPAKRNDKERDPEAAIPLVRNEIIHLLCLLLMLTWH